MNKFRLVIKALVLAIFALAPLAQTQASPNAFLMPATGSPVTQAPYYFPCQGGKHYSGSLSFAGDFDYQPTWYYSSTIGHHKGCLYGPSSGPDFDLYLQKWIDSTWVIVASAEGGSSNAFISYSGSRATTGGRFTPTTVQAVTTSGGYHHSADGDHGLE